MTHALYTQYLAFEMNESESEKQLYENGDQQNYETQDVSATRRRKGKARKCLPRLHLIERVCLCDLSKSALSLSTLCGWFVHLCSLIVFGLLQLHELQGSAQLPPQHTQNIPHRSTHRHPAHPHIQGRREWRWSEVELEVGRCTQKPDTPTYQPRHTTR